MVEYHLKILSTDEQEQELLELTNGFSIGSAQDNDLTLKQSTIQSKHCVFRLHNDILSVHSNDTNGTTSIDNFPLKAGKSYIVDQGDTIIIGNFRGKIYKNLGEMKDNTKPLQELINEAAVKSKSSENAINESLEEYDDDIFANVDPTQMTQLPQEFSQTAATSEDDDIQPEITEPEITQPDLLDAEGDQSDPNATVVLNLDDIRNMNMQAAATPMTPSPSNAVDESFEEYDDDDMFANVDPTAINKIPQELNYKKDITNPEITAVTEPEIGQISEEDLDEDDDYNVEDGSENESSRPAQVFASRIDITRPDSFAPDDDNTGIGTEYTQSSGDMFEMDDGDEDDKTDIMASLEREEVREEPRSEVVMLGTGVDLPDEDKSVVDQDVFRSFDFKEEKSGLLGSKDIEQIKQDAIDNMASDMSTINILPTENEDEEVDFSFGDTDDQNDAFSDAKVDETPLEAKTKSYIKDFEMKTSLSQMEMDNDSDSDSDSDSDADEFAEQSSGSYNTGIVDLGQEKTKIFEKRIEEGEELYQGTEIKMEAIGVEPLPPKQEFRPAPPARSGLNNDDDSDQNQKGAATQEVKKSTGLFNKLKDAFQRPEDNLDDEFDDDDDDDLDDDLDDDDDLDEEWEKSRESTLSGVTNLITGIFKKKDVENSQESEDLEDSSKSQDKDKAAPQASQEKIEKTDLKLVEPQEEISQEKTVQMLMEKAQSQGANINTKPSGLSEDDIEGDESKDYFVSETDGGTSDSVTNVNLKDLNEKLKELEEEGKQQKKTSFFKSLFKSKNKKNDDLEFEEEDEDNSEASEQEVTKNIAPPDENKTLVDVNPDLMSDATRTNSEVEVTELLDEVAEVSQPKQTPSNSNFSDNNSAPSLARVIKNAKRRKKFKHGDFPWVLGRLYAMICNLLIAKIVYDFGLKFLDLQLAYDLKANWLYQKVIPYWGMFREALYSSYSALPQHIPQSQELLNKIGIETILDNIFQFTYFKYIILYIMIEAWFSILLGTSLPKFLMGVRSTDRFPLNGLKGLFISIFGTLTLPFLIFDLPILIRMRSFKEIITRTEYYYRGRKQLIFVSLFLLPVLIGLWYISTYFAQPIKVIPPIENLDMVKTDQNELDGLATFTSKQFQLRGQFYNNEKFVYLPVWDKPEKSSVERKIVLVDTFLNENASISLKSITPSKQLTQIFENHNPLLKYFIEQPLTFTDLKKYSLTSLKFDRNVPLTLLGPINEKIPFSNSFINLRNAILDKVTLPAPTKASSQEMNEKLILMFSQDGSMEKSQSDILLLSENELRVYHLSFNGKNNKAKDRLTRTFLPASNEIPPEELDFNAKFNAFNAFDLAEKLNNPELLKSSTRKSIVDFYLDLGKKVVQSNESSALKLPYIVSLKGILGNFVESQRETKLYRKLEEILAAVENSDKSYFARGQNQSVKSSKPKNFDQGRKKSSSINKKSSKRYPNKKYKR